MDLLKRLKDTERVRPAAFDEARAVLQAAMAVEEMTETNTMTKDDNVTEIKTASHRRARWSTRRTVGFGAAGLAAAAAVALVVTSTSTPSHTTSASGGHSAGAVSAGGNPILVSLAADITPLQAKPGDATLEIRNQSPTSDAVGDHGVELFTDDGTHYWAVDKKTLVKRAKDPAHEDEGEYKRAIAAALSAVKGDVGAARAQMAVANLTPGTHPIDAMPEKLKAIATAKGKKYVPPKPLTPVQEKERTDNHIWLNCTSALLAAPENPQVRAGVLRIVASMPNVKVTKTTNAGQPTLTLTDTWPKSNPGYAWSLIINAKTGAPIAEVSKDPGKSAKTDYIHTSRVRFADIKAGKF
ncbi:hypothetical protein GCM10010151_55830 [Actinoallomurus spadix]|uniref:Uncharacterized protein n=2 Tax=Actinoallomurus spadix TaxID=79912 RepID=A0ABP3H4X2_9ACTN